MSVDEGAGWWGAVLVAAVALGALYAALPSAELRSNAMTRPPILAPTPLPVPAAPQPAASAAWLVDLDAGTGMGDGRVASMSLRTLVSRDQEVRVRFDLDAVTRPMTIDEVHRSADWVAGVRLLLGEMGAWRLANGRWSLLEAVGILETVRNRFDPDLANPLGKPGVAAWPGCGVGAVFARCIDPGQYRGLDSDRALRPADAVPDGDTLASAVDQAVLAWFVFEEALLGEITSGATSFVHHCGGTKYGAPPEACVGAGADPVRGPIVYRGPAAWSAKEGRYTLETLATVDFVAGPRPTEAGAYPELLRR